MALLQHVALQFEPGPLVRGGWDCAQQSAGYTSGDEPGGSGKHPERTAQALEIEPKSLPCDLDSDTGSRECRTGGYTGQGHTESNRESRSLAETMPPSLCPWQCQPSVMAPSPGTLEMESSAVWPQQVRPVSRSGPVLRRKPLAFRSRQLTRPQPRNKKPPQASPQGRENGTDPEMSRIRQKMPGRCGGDSCCPETSAQSREPSR